MFDAQCGIFILISSTFFTLYKLLKLKKESYPRIISSKNKLYPPFQLPFKETVTERSLPINFRACIPERNYVLGIYKVWNMLHHGSVERV